MNEQSLNCAQVERELAQLLAEPAPGPDATARVARLRDHAAGCPNCRGTGPLLDMALERADRRDPLPDPGRPYWAGFGRRVAERVRHEERAARGARVWLALAAAALIVVLLTAWPAGGPPALERELESVFAEAPAAELEAFSGLADDEAAGSLLLPSLEELDEDTERALLDWLDAEDARLAEGAV